MEVVGVVEGLGQVPTLIVLVCLMIAFLLWVIRMMVVISKDIKDMKSLQATKDKEQDDKINHLQQHYVTKEDMFQQFGGWRTEIGNVSQQILHLTELIAKGKE